MTYDLARKGFLQGYVNYTYNFKEFVITLNFPGDASWPHGCISNNYI